MTARRLSRVVVLAGAGALAALVVAGPAPQDRPTTRPQATDDVPPNRVIERELRDRDQEWRYVPPSIARLLTAPRPSRPGPEGWRPLVPDRDEARTTVLARRAVLRAYDGAPPVMPHSRSFVRTKTCLDCHAEGIRIGERLGPPISHPHLLNCLQCHVESTNLDLPMPGRAPANAFDGTTLPFEGARAWPGAPPAMPHATLMRTDCLACHGPAGDPGLRTAHPERSNCVQCHAPAAALDQTSPFFTGNDPMRVTAPPGAAEK